MTTRFGALTLSLALLLSTACGGGDEPAENPEPLAETGGDEAPAPQPEVEDEPEPEPEPVPVGPGQLRVVNRVGGQEVGGRVRVLSEAGEVVAEGDAGATFNVDSGSYRVVGEITDADVLIDTPTHELEGMVTVPAGETATAEVDFPVSRILLNVTRRGRPVRSWRLQVTREGFDAGEPVTLTPSREHIPITPGRYSGTLTTGGSQIEVTGLIFQGGARMTVPVAVN